MKSSFKRFTSTSCISCSMKKNSTNHKNILSKLCLGHVAMVSAFIYIALSQILT